MSKNRSAGFTSPLREVREGTGKACTCKHSFFGWLQPEPTIQITGRLRTGDHRDCYGCIFGRSADGITRADRREGLCWVCGHIKNSEPGNRVPAGENPAKVRTQIAQSQRTGALGRTCSRKDGRRPGRSRIVLRARRTGEKIPRNHNFV